MIPEDAFSAGTLGTERAGSGVLIRTDGLVLTIGYLVTEAETIWLTSVEAALFLVMCLPTTRNRFRSGPGVGATEHPIRLISASGCALAR